MSFVDDFRNAKIDKGEAHANRLLFSWLSCDTRRRALYDELIEEKQILMFESRAFFNDQSHSGFEDRPKKFRQKACLVVHPDHVAEVYKNSGECAWSNTPYKDLGGTFMLALDEPAPDPASGRVDSFLSPRAQREYCYKLLQRLTTSFDCIATVAFKAGAGLALKQRDFDLAELAEMVAVNYVARLFGFSQADLPLLKTTANAIGNGLMFVNAGQHFITDSTALPLAKQALSKLSNRAAELIDLYDRAIEQEQIDRSTDLQEEFKELRDTWFENPAQPRESGKFQQLKDLNFRPLMELMANEQQYGIRASAYSTTEKAIMVAGLVSGTITNLRAAVCIAVQQFFELPFKDLDRVRSAAKDARVQHHDANWTDTQAGVFRALVEEALRINPPPPFVPRRAAKTMKLGHQQIDKDCALIIAVGGASYGGNPFSIDATPSRSEPPDTLVGDASKESDCPFSKVFGGRPETVTTHGSAEYPHSCIGRDLAMYSVSYTVRQLMLLPGLTQSLDQSTGEVVGLVKRAGFICERYPLEYEREKLLRQSPLQTVLQVRNPVPEHAAALRQVLQFGAPFIEKVLREARHVHFASFMFLDNDSKLVLFTAYDGDFDAYIGHFAREFGPLFDRFFSHIENGPPAPIAKHPFEFVQFLRRFQQPAVGGLFFSAYPEVQVDQIRSHFDKDRRFDFFTMEGEK